LSKPPARELIELSAALRARVEWEGRRGRRALHDGSLREALLAPPPARKPEGHRAPAPSPSAAAPSPPRPAPPSSPAPRPAPAPAAEQARGKKLPLLDPEPEPKDYGSRVAALAELEVQLGKPIRLQTESLYMLDQFDVVLM